MKPIFITQQDKEELIKEFSKALENSLYEGEFKFSKTFKFNNQEHEPALLAYTSDAFAKMVMLLKEFDSEVAWHCLVRRGEDPGVFIVYDLIVYPQEVTGATVNTDDEGYAKFMIDLTDEQAEFMHMQCHSHVNMGTSPSSTDKQHQSQVLQTMNGKGFYVFQIWNKRLESTSFIYDFDNNIQYEDKDVLVEIMDNNWSFVSFFTDDAKKIVKASTPPAKPASTPVTGATYSWTPGVNNSKEAKKRAAKNEAKKKAYQAAYFGDDDEDWYDKYGYSSDWYCS